MMSTSTSPPPSLSSFRFSVLHSFPLPGDITCTKYRSSATGLHVVLARIPGPIVNGYFVLPTESTCDDGCPHTLEHLVFMGSELYPWKGVLDLLANRHLSQGTNAWTDTDHTAYTLETAGAEGFLALLPIYLDHILYPTLTKSGFVTEVHHITGEGKNAGVVYCEMQARENTGESLVHRALLEGLYPGVCGYKSETGGIMKDLRTLTIETIRDYHKSYYRPDNLTVIITGDVTLEQVAKSLEPFEQRIVSKGSLSPMTRPFSSPVPPLTTSVDKTITFASDDEDVGMVHLGFRGPLWADFESRTALDIMWRYLTQSSVSPLQQEFCETEEPLCGEIDASMIDNSITIHMVTFDNAETETLFEIKPLFFKVVGEIADKGVDMERMHTVIKKEIRSQLNSFEANPHRKVCSYAIEQALYGLDHPHQRPEQSQFAQLVDVRSRLEHLLEQPSSYWSCLLHRYILDTPYVCIVGVPSKAESEHLRITEEERETEQKNKLGPEGLKQAQHELDEANRFNSMPLPPTFLSSFPEPSISRVPEIPVYTIRSKGFTFHDVNTRNESAYLAAHPSASKITEHVAKQSIQIQDVPVLIQFDHIPSQFVQVQALLDTSRLPNELLSWIPLFREIMFESNIIQPNGEVIKALQVVHMLEDETVSYGSKYGLSGSRFSCGVFSQFIFVALKLEAESYAKAIRWLSNILWHTQFTADRIKVAVKRMLADIPQLKNEGRYMTKVGLSHVKFASRSNHHAINFIRQQTFLKSLEKNLNDTTYVTRIVDTLEKLRNIITEPKYVRMHVAMDVLKQSQLFKTWKDELRHPSLAPPPVDGAEEKKAASAHSHEHDHAHGLLYASRDVNRAVNGTDYIVSIPASESSFLLACTDVQVPSFEHGQVASIKVALEYLCACEGPLWKRIRGLGYAYSYSMQLNVEEGLLYFMLYRSTNVSAAWDQAYQIVKDFVQKPESIDLVSLTSSKSSLVFEVLSSADTIGAAATESLYHVLRKADVGYTSRLLSMIGGVSLGDVNDVLSKHVMALFDQKQSTSVIACNPSSLSTIITELAKAPFSRQLVTINSLTEWFGEKKSTDATKEEKKGMGCDWCKAVKSGGKHTHGTAAQDDDDPDILPAQRFRWLYINPVFVKRALNLSLLGVGVHLAYQIISTIRSRK